MGKLFGIVFFVIGVFIARGIFIPRFRSRWSGTKIVCGWIGCVGYTLCFMSLGLNFFFSESLSAPLNVLLVIIFATGCLLAFIGGGLDWLKARRTTIRMGSFQTICNKKKGEDAS